ncbi:MAG: MFS transporter [Cyclobacteriaceae bacterium]
MNKQTRILTLIVFSQFMCTSLWFAGNAVMPDLSLELGLEVNDLGYLTSSVQFGFIAGTLFFAFYTIADRFNPSLVFFVSALFGALFNLLIVLEGVGFIHVLFLRFLTGFFLAGIYPVGMKIASDYFARGLGRALSFLVGALVLGTAFPHLVSDLKGSFSWEAVVYVTSALALLGGLLMLLFVKSGPFRKPGQKQKFGAIFQAFRNENFRAASFGYFGHMWELYAFWAFVPVMLFQYSDNATSLNVPFWAFLIIGLGGVACFFGGLLSERFGERKIVLIALAGSGICCLASPLMFHASPTVFIAFLLLWGWLVIVDSPLLSTLIAHHADPEFRGTSLTIVNCLGFSITIVSIQLLVILMTIIPFEYLFLILAIGPVFGVRALLRPD